MLNLKKFKLFIFFITFISCLFIATSNVEAAAKVTVIARASNGEVYIPAADEKLSVTCTSSLGGSTDSVQTVDVSKEDGTAVFNLRDDAWSCRFSEDSDKAAKNVEVTVRTYGAPETVYLDTWLDKNGNSDYDDSSDVNNPNSETSITVILRTMNGEQYVRKSTDKYIRVQCYGVSYTKTDWHEIAVGSSSTTISLEKGEWPWSCDLQVNSPEYYEEIDDLVVEIDRSINPEIKKIYFRLAKVGGTKVMLGDADGDGDVDSGDLATLDKYLFGWDVAISLDNSDINKDNNVDKIDLGILHNYIWGHCNSLQACIENSNNNNNNNNNEDNTNTEPQYGTLTVKYLDENGKYLVGGWLRLVNSKGEELRKWETKNADEVIKDLAPGTYTIEEVKAATGYASVSEVEVTIKKGENFDSKITPSVLVKVPDTLSNFSKLIIIAGITALLAGIGLLYFNAKRTEEV